MSKLIRTVLRPTCSKDLTIRTLERTYKGQKIKYCDLQSSILHTWKLAKLVDIVICENEFHLLVCCEEDQNLLRKDIYYRAERTLTDSMVRVTRELNAWNAGVHALERIHYFTCGPDWDGEHDISCDKTVSLPLGIPISRIIEFYGVSNTS